MGPLSLWAFDYDRAVFEFGQWATTKRKRTRTEGYDPPDAKSRPTREVPFYTDEQFNAMVGMTVPKRENPAITAFTDAAIDYLTMKPVPGADGPQPGLPSAETPAGPD